MANSSLLKDYIQQGTHAARPAAPLVASTVTAFYYETDTLHLFLYDWNAGAWTQVALSTGSGDFQKITETVTAGSQASVTFSAIAASFRDLIVRVRGASSLAATSDTLSVQLNGDTGANYDYQLSLTDGAFTSFAATYAAVSITAGHLAAANGPASASGWVEMLFPDYRGTTFNKSVRTDAGATTGTSGNNMVRDMGHGNWRSTAAITSIKVFPAGGNFVNNSVVSLYGSN